MDDPQDEHGALLLEHVVHHAVVTDPQAKEAIAAAADSLGGLPSTAARIAREALCQLDESCTDLALKLGREFAELAGSGRR